MLFIQKEDDLEFKMAFWKEVGNRSFIQANKQLVYTVQLFYLLTSLKLVLKMSPFTVDMCMCHMFEHWRHIHKGAPPGQKW